MSTPGARDAASAAHLATGHVGSASVSRPVLVGRHEAPALADVAAQAVASGLPPNRRALVAAGDIRVQVGRVAESVHERAAAVDPSPVRPVDGPFVATLAWGGAEYVAVGGHGALLGRQ